MPFAEQCNKRCSAFISISTSASEETGVSDSPAIIIELIESRQKSFVLVSDGRQYRDQWFDAEQISSRQSELTAHVCLESQPPEENSNKVKRRSSLSQHRFFSLE